MSVPNRGYVVSKNDLIRWKDPRRLRAVPLHDLDPWGSGSFQLHECGYLADCGDWQYNGLCNPYWRLYYNGKKGARVEVAGRRVALGPDRIVLIPENTAFDARGTAGVPHLWMHFSPPLSPGLVPDLLSVPLDAPLAANLTALRELLLRRVDLEEGGKRRLFHACLAVLHCWFSAKALPVRPALPPALARLLEHIERSLPGDLSNAVLAGLAGMSVEGFLRWFKGRLGMTPARYVARRRIREACRLLALSERSIEEIAERVGFANRHHFSRVFLRHTGRSPALFRREQGSAKEDTGEEPGRARR
ncbi:MAG: AraC family transcriptional regulator [Chthoniobacteraceae bacterium]|nr:AraC family transcriptional regulator [Chthoniobacteraceae bacterium]